LTLDSGLQLESDHPEFWNEKAYLLGRLKRHQESLDCYRRAASVRDWAPAQQVARALRGQGVQLVNLNLLDEAEAALRRSLELEPDSEVARNELGYIEGVRSKGEAEKEELSWFLQSFINPPTDPLTVQLLALVEELPSIPGPKTVGSENYLRIVDAFMTRGWGDSKKNSTSSSTRAVRIMRTLSGICSASLYSTSRRIRTWQSWRLGRRPSTTFGRRIAEVKSANRNEFRRRTEDVVLLLTPPGRRDHFKSAFPCRCVPSRRDSPEIGEVRIVPAKPGIGPS
jgi:tetratricopeptide (TPR) repeat protein